ncbi:hypothetical protein [Oceanobacillus sojae]|uniref:Uncharacterized protein n=1 Tax=Oceanobacillus sojae TaxID=582851 RepID=A0A511ZFS6_9BACI|nr:hypothetical protein [Oceanobacillus sojae]GEN86302.1 hypothetical protein OSO01_10410 [Oceanobacillus sojae]
MWAKKVIFFFFLGLSILFLIISILSWNMLLGACSFVIALGLTRYLDDAGLPSRYSRKEVKKELKEMT